jgi:hypothetical protein
MTMLSDPPALTTPDAKIPDGPVEEKWSSYKEHARLVAPNNKRKFTVIVVPRQPAPGALDRRPGRHQRRQELPGRR